MDYYGCIVLVAPPYCPVAINELDTDQNPTRAAVTVAWFHNESDSHDDGEDGTVKDRERERHSCSFGKWTLCRVCVLHVATA